MKTMNVLDARRVKVGQEVRVIPLWNRTEPPSHRVLSPTEVLRVRRVSGTQTGVLITVATVTGRNLELDAGWFQA